MPSKAILVERMSRYEAFLLCKMFMPFLESRDSLGSGWSWQSSVAKMAHADTKPAHGSCEVGTDRSGFTIRNCNDGPSMNHM